MNVALLNGQPAGVDDLRALALVNYGHFTSIQVRDHAVQGMELHCRRLLAGTRELFGTELDFDAVRAQMRAAVADTPDCTLRVTIYSRQFDYRVPAQTSEPDVLVSLAPASPPRTLPLRVKSFAFLRPLPHIKHVGTFPLFHYRRQAIAAGFDDALFADGAGLIAEGSIWNLGFWQRGRVVWPEGPALRGTAERMLQAALDRQGIDQQTRPVSLDEVHGFEAAFACNASGIQPITAIDRTVLAAAHPGLSLLRNAAASYPWEGL